MKTLKVFAFTMSMVMVFSITSLAAFSDVSKEDSFHEAVSILSQLKILTGYENGTFKPGETITRAEFSAVICRLLGMGESVKGNTGNSFTDVSSVYWANEYIYAVNMLGIVNGYGDGTFGPDNDVKYEEAVKMVICALGYNEKAAALGGYPTGYIMVANQLGITMGTTQRVGNSENGAARSTVAKLVFNSLTVPMMDQISFGEKAEYVVDVNSSILYTKFEIIKAEIKVEKVLDGSGEGKAEVEYISIPDSAKANNWYVKNGTAIIGSTDEDAKQLPSTITIGDFDLTASAGAQADAYISAHDALKPILMAYYVK